VKQKDILARGAFEPLITEELFELAQQHLNGRSRRQKGVKHHEDWPLRRFVLCGSCGKALTSGWVKNSKGKPYGFYFCVQKGCRAVSARKEAIERDWVNLLGMMQPTIEGVNQVAEMAAAGWQHRRVRAEEEQRQLTLRLTAQHDLNKQTIEARVKGKISDEDFATMKAAIAAEVGTIEQGLKRLEDERMGMQELIKNTELRLENLAMWWQKASLEDRVELQFSLWPDGLHWSDENSFLNTRNRSLFQMVREMVRDLSMSGGR
jgi:site-specific DNA recombinase